MRGNDDGSSHSDCGLGAWSDDEQPLPGGPCPALPVLASRPSTAAALIHGTEDLPPACQAVLRRTANALEASITAPPLPHHLLHAAGTLPERPRTRAQADESDFVTYVHQETASADFYKPSSSSTSKADVLSLEAAYEPACLQRQEAGRHCTADPQVRPELARQASTNRRLSSSVASSPSDLSALPTITFPLAAGLSSLSRRRSSSAARHSTLLPQDSGASYTRPPVTAALAAAGGEPPAPPADLDVVRQLLLQRRPDMVQVLEAALAEGCLHDEDESW